eukprot:gene5431-952_t
MSSSKSDYCTTCPGSKAGRMRAKCESTAVLDAKCAVVSGEVLQR